jgi:hypothetical protein
MATMDTTWRYKKNVNSRSTLFMKINLHADERVKNRTSITLATDHHGHRYQGGERPNGAA